MIRRTGRGTAAATRERRRLRCKDVANPSDGQQGKNRYTPRCAHSFSELLPVVCCRRAQNTSALYWQLRRHCSGLFWRIVQKSPAAPVVQSRDPHVLRRALCVNGVIFNSILRILVWWPFSWNCWLRCVALVLHVYFCVFQNSHVLRQPARNPPVL